ncbi:PP2C family protein-serine/threonine phosphatase [Streptomyces sp. NPDC092296]|uniref:PP2C family protein-serine/threonine phosphatase n=1 Tax=Streptomyces sp. NPDC092296 TaxID=3366012 RepID=UPI00380685B3
MERIRVGAAEAVRAIPVLLVLAGSAADVLAPEPYAGLPLLTAAPLAAALVLSFRGAALVAVFTCAVSLVTDLLTARPLSALLVDLADVLVISAIALGLNAAMARQDRRLAVTSRIAEAAQRAVLPAAPPRVGPLDVAVRYEAAQAQAAVGGDLYAVQDTPFGVRAMLGDVCGKGLQAISTVSVVVGAFREAAEEAPTLEDLARRLDRALDRAAESGGGRPAAFERFTTALLAEVVPASGTVNLLSRGHPPPYLVRDASVTCLESLAAGPPLGLGLGGGDGEARAASFPFPCGASLVMVTDGVTEARDGQGTFYDPRSGLAAGLRHRPDELTDLLVDDVADWTGGRRQDDLAIVVLTRRPTG